MLSYHKVQNFDVLKTVAWHLYAITATTDRNQGFQMGVEVKIVVVLRCLTIL